MWDWVISLIIIIALILAMWAKVSRQTIPELLRSIKDYLTETTEEAPDYATEVISNE